MDRPLSPSVATLALAAAFAAVAESQADGSAGERLIDLIRAPVTPALGGDTTTGEAGADAFSQIAANAPEERRQDFSFGARLFNIEWVPFPSPVKIFDGLGPTFNRDACGGCHQANGRGRPPGASGVPMDSMLVRLSAPAGEAGIVAHPSYGDQLNDRAMEGVSPEGRVVIDYEEVAGAYADGTPYTLLRPHLSFADLAYGPLDGALTSPRVAPAVIGLGLLEAVPDATLEALSDPEDRDGDGVSGRINWLPDDNGERRIGRFGWKANVTDLRHQSAAAAVGDMGLTTTLFPRQNCPPSQADCAVMKHETGPEISDPFLERIVTTMRTVAVPVQRDYDNPTIIAGLDAFRRFGCATCHLPTLETDSTAAFPELRGQTFHPFTDLLLHDMGDGLADGRPDGSATGSEWRTPPLWGLGLVPAVNGHDRLLHDGRARGFAEAILWHGGEAEAAKEAFRKADEVDRDSLLAFLSSL
jgi:CxxC motif-containing protein (DUF1111 family)